MSWLSTHGRPTTSMRRSTSMPAALTDDGVKDGLAVEAEGEKTAVGLTGEDAGGPGHLVEGLERERGSLALIVPTAFAGDDVEGGDARVGGLHHDEALADDGSGTSVSASVARQMNLPSAS